MAPFREESHESICAQSARTSVQNDWHHDLNHLVHRDDQLDASSREEVLTKKLGAGAILTGLLFVTWLRPKRGQSSRIAYIKQEARIFWVNVSRHKEAVNAQS